MSAWDMDPDAPDYLIIKENGIGEFHFGSVDAGIDCRIEKVGGVERLAFSFEGSDEGDDVSGRGWIVVKGREMNGWFCFHLGDESTFRAEKKE